MADEQDSISIDINGNASGVQKSSDAASSAIKATTATAADLAKAFVNLQKSLDPTFAAQERYNRSLDDNRKLLAAGVIGGQEFAAGNRAAASALQEATAAIEANSAASKKMAADQAAAQKVIDDAARDAGIKAAQEAANAAKQADAAKIESSTNAARVASAAAISAAAQVKAAWAAVLAAQIAGDAEAANSARATAAQQATVAKEASEAARASRREATDVDRSSSAEAITLARQAADASREASATSAQVEVAANATVRASNRAKAADKIASEKAAAAQLRAQQEADAAAEAAVVAAANAQQVQSFQATAAAAAAAALAAAAEVKAAWADAVAAQIAGDVDAANNAKAVAIAKSAVAKQSADDAKTAAVAAAAVDKGLAQDAITLSAQAGAAAKQANNDKSATNKIAAQTTRDVATANREASTTEAQLNASLSQFQGMVSPAAAATQRYNQQMQQLVQLLMAGKLQEGEFIQVQQRLMQQQDSNTRSLGRQNMGYIDLGYQIQDVVASYASGIHPLVILAQQGGQTADAIRMMGGKFEGVAAFIGGPWGAAILGAVTVLGFLIPKLFDTETALDRANRAEKDFGDQVDTTTGKIKSQVTALETLAAQKNEQALQTSLGKGLDKEKQRIAAQGSAATQESYSAGAGDVGGVVVPADIKNGTSARQVKDLSDDLAAGRIQLDGYLGKLKDLGGSDPQVKKLFDDMFAGVSKVSAEAAKSGKNDSYLGQEKTLRESSARLKVLNGEQLTDEEKKTVGIETREKRLGDAYVVAAATYSIATDSVEKATAQYTMKQQELRVAKEDAVAAGVSSIKATTDEIKALAPYKKAVDDARAAKTAQRKEDSLAAKEARAAAAAAAQEKKDDMESVVADAEYQKSIDTKVYADQVADQQKKIDALKAYYGEVSKQVINAQRELQAMEKAHQDKLFQIQQAGDTQKAKEQADSLKTQQQVAKSNLDSTAAGLEAEHTIGAVDGQPYLEAKRAILEQEYDMNVDFANRIYQVQLDALNAKLAKEKEAYGTERTEYATLQNQISDLSSSHLNENAVMLAQHNEQVAASNASLIENASARWHTASDSITGSLNTAFDDIWTHQHKFGQDMLALADNLVEAEAQAGFKMVSNWLANEIAKTTASLFGSRTRAATAALAQGQQIAQGTAGVIAHTTTEIAKTGATVGGVAARSGAESTGFFARVFGWLAAALGIHVATETGKTAATVTGSITRVAAAKAEALLEMGPQIALAGAGGVASMAAAPFPLDLGAPAFGASMAAAAAGFGTLISAAGGYGEVDSDQMAMIHKKEMILPAWIAQPFRDSLKGAGPTRSTGFVGSVAASGAAARQGSMGQGDVNFHYKPQHNNQNVDMNTLLQRDGATLRRWVKNQARNGAFKGNGQ